MYLDFAELQALKSKAMKMADWITKLDDFLKVSDENILQNAGKVTADLASKKALIEFDKYKKEQDKNYISDFDREVKKLLKSKKILDQGVREHFLSEKGKQKTKDINERL